MDRFTPRRRAAALAIVALVAAGCGSSSDGDDAGPDATTPAPTETPTDTPTATSVQESAAGASSDPETTPAPEPAVEPTVAATSPPDDTTTTEPEPVGHTVVDARGESVTVESVERIIPLDGDVAEIVFALGFGDRVVATDLSATYPPEADALPQIGYQRTLSAEPIIAFEPTLLIGTDIAGPPETLADLERVGIPLVIVPNEPTETGSAEKIRAIAAALGVPDEGEVLASEVQSTIDTAIAARVDGDEPPKVAALYIRGTSAQLVLGSDSSVYWLIGAAGGVSISDELGLATSAPITAEAILAAAPDVLLVPSAGLQSVGGVDGLLESIPALAETPAGQNRAVLDYDDQLMLGNGPRTGDFLVQLIADIATVTAR